MSNRTKELVRKVVSEVGKQWDGFGEPLPLTMVGARWNGPFVREFGAGWDATRFCGYMEELGVLKVVRMRSGKQWVFLAVVWEGMSEAERAGWVERCETLVDPLNEAMKKKGAGKNRWKKIPE